MPGRKRWLLALMLLTGQVWGQGDSDRIKHQRECESRAVSGEQ
ncbi:Uncharacterised protein [Citrobacter koseri]|uniref:Uncharacterized protein n=1 Tax=Citrobacter koseri TaxID=545 RepID=A0A447UGA8_CITKO|nr:Uncharacterised protein [Citrobacter koseri]